LSFSDDHASPAAPFFGDETGEIFETPDVVFHSPTTTERVVDTQSGFLVVIKRIDSRLALSVKRRLGTPPVSSILLTPDESLKLSRILAGPVQPGNSPRFTASTIERRRLPGIEEPEIDEIDFSAESENESADGNGTKDISRSLAIDGFRRSESEKSSDRIDAELDGAATEPGAIDTSRSWSTWDKLSGAQPTEKGTLSAFFLICLLLAGIAAGMGGTALYVARHHKPAPPAVVVPVETPQMIEARQIDKLAREYVSNLLDFNPATYRYSQIRAMANMTPELMARYWKETHFPLSLNQLRMVSRNESIAVTQVTPEPVADPQIPQVNVFANMVGTDGNIASSVHLKLSLEKAPDGSFRVNKQQDVSGK
jgi:hypothetical protein